MKKYFNYIPILFSILLFAASCKDDVNLVDENNKWLYLDSANNANIKFINVYTGTTPRLPTAPSIYTGPQFLMYANGAKLNGSPLGYIAGTTYTGTATTPNALGIPWPITNVYATIPGGSTRFDIINGRMNLTVVPNIPAFIAGDTLATFTASLDKGKYYSLYIGDSFPNVRVTVKEDILAVPEYQNYKIRLANFIMNSTDTLNVFSRRQNAEIITGVTHKNVSDWVVLPLPAIVDTMEIRKKGSTAIYITVIGNSGTYPQPNFSPTGIRMYTILARGKTGITGKLPSASYIVNR